MCKKTLWSITILRGDGEEKKNQSEKLLIVRKVTREPRCKRTRCLFLLISFLWTLSWQHIETFPLASYRLWTSSWQSAPYIWTHDPRNPSEELHNGQRPLPFGEREDYAVIPIPVWCLVPCGDVWRGAAGLWTLHTAPPPPFLPAPPPDPTLPQHPPPEFALWLKRRDGLERRVALKDTAKSGRGSSRFVIIVRFKCFCKNVVNLPTLLQSLGALGWYKYSAHSVCFQLQNFSVLSVLTFPRWVLSFPRFSGKCELITICSLTWRVLGRCLYCSVLGMLQYLYSNSMNDRVLWKHCWKSALLSSLGLGFLLYCYMLQAWQKLRDEEYNFCNKIVILNVKAPSWILVVCIRNMFFGGWLETSKRDRERLPNKCSVQRLLRSEEEDTWDKT